jgi:hypothetical protein
MKIGGYTVYDDDAPSDMTLIQPDKACSSVKTFAGVDFFSYGLTLLGKTLQLSWDYMTTRLFTQVDTMFRADVPVVFDPEDGSGQTFSVEITKCDGKYFTSFEGRAGFLRKDAVVELLIMEVLS